MNIKKCLITIVSGILITAVTHAQEASEDLTAEQHQLAQQKAELDAREKALDRREKKLAEKKGPQQVPLRGPVRRKSQGQASANHSPEPGRTSESGARRKEVTRTIFATSGRSVSGATGHACIHATRSRTRRTRVAFRRRRSIRRRFLPAIGKSAELRSLVIRASLHPYPLMQAIYEGPGGQAWKDSKDSDLRLGKFLGKHQHFTSIKDRARTEIFRWFTIIRPNRMELNQIVLYVERVAG